MIAAFIEFCGLLAAAMMLSLLWKCNPQTDSRDSHHGCVKSPCNSIPLRLTGGGNIAECDENDILNCIDPENSISEQDIRDISFDAGYTTEAINDILSSKSKTKSESSNSILSEEDDISESDSGTENAFDELKGIRIKNVNNVIIGTLNINSLAPKFEQLQEIIGKSLDILREATRRLEFSRLRNQMKN